MNPNAAVFVPGAAFTPTAPAAPVSKAGYSRPGVDRPLPKVATTEQELLDLLDYLEKEVILCVDCEGADLSKGSWRDGRMLPPGPVPLHGRLCLLQLGTLKGEAFAIDVLELGERTFELGLRKLLESERPIKVVHDFRQDADALRHQFNVHPRGLFDCQLADIMLRRLNGHRTTYVQGSAKLLSAHGIDLGSVSGYGLITQEQKQAIHERFSQDRHLWERRPLPADMLEYALEDVRPMPKLQHKLLEALGALLPGGLEAALKLVIAGSNAYAEDFASLPRCRCRLCCNAAENARFDGYRLMTRLAELPPGQVKPEILQYLWRPEDNQPLSEPGPSRFYVNEMDESVPLPGY